MRFSYLGERVARVTTGAILVALLGVRIKSNLRWWAYESNPHCQEGEPTNEGDGETHKLARSPTHRRSMFSPKTCFYARRENVECCRCLYFDIKILSPTARPPARRLGTTGETRARCDLRAWVSRSLFFSESVLHTHSFVRFEAKNVSTLPHPPSYLLPLLDPCISR